MTLQVSNIAGDGRHVVKPRDFPRHAEVYAPPDNWRGMKARKDYKEPDHNRDTVHGGELQEGGETSRRSKSPASPEKEDAWLCRVASGRRMVTPCGFLDGHSKQAPSRQHRHRRETHGGHTVRREMDGPHETE